MTAIVISSFFILCAAPLEEAATNPEAVAPIPWIKLLRFMLSSPSQLKPPLK